MVRCAECSDRLLEFLYGLLEADEAAALGEHLASCPACQTALAEAEGQQRLLTRAAHVTQQVPAFVAPSDEPAPEGFTEQPAAALPEPVATGPPTIAFPALPPRPRRRWPWLATAAALLLLAGGGYWSYNSGLERRQAALETARAEVNAIDARFASATRTFKRDLDQLPDQVRARQLQLEVTGPARYQVNAPSQVRVVTQHAAGTAAQLKVAVVDDTTKRSLWHHESKSAGEAVIALPAGLPLKPAARARLVVRAETRRGGEAEVGTELIATRRTYLTHVALNKPVYRVGDVVRFRTLTLDRFTLQPPGRELALHFILRDAQHRPVRQLQGKSRPDGISGGEFALTGDLAGGDYTLAVTPAASASAAGEGVLPQTRHLLVVRDQAPALASFGLMQPQVQFDRSKYEPGDKVRAELFFKQSLNHGGGAANQSVLVKAADPAGTPIPVKGAAPGQPLQTRTDAQGKASFELQLPGRIPAGKPMVEVEVRNGNASTRFRQDIPVGTTHPDVAFFPEGGDLVAGVANRVYCQAQTSQGAPADLAGRIVNQQGQEVAKVETARAADEAAGARGLGLFTFTPQAAETYTLQIPASGNTTVVLPLPAARAAGMVLSVPEAVGPEGDPIHAVVRSAGPERQVLVLASCRGHIVDQQFVTSSPAGTEVRLQPVAGTRGVVRLTVYEVSQDQLVPRAERLAYRVPAERLVLSLARGDQEAVPSYQPGARVDMTLKAVNEKAKPANAYLLAAVVDERALPPSQSGEQGPPAFFYLAAELPDGPELEDADFLVNESPAARAALDLFLGTHGWRRFAERGPAPLLAHADQPAQAGFAADQPAVFRIDNIADMKTRYEAALAKGRQELRQKAQQERQALQEERDEHSRTAAAAAAALRAYQDLPRSYLGTAIGVAVLVLLAAGGIFLTAGFIRAVRGARPTVAFASAFVSLLLCLIIYGANGYLRQEAGDSSPLASRNQGPEQQLGQLPEVAQIRDVLGSELLGSRSGPVGRFAEAAGARREALADGKPSAAAPAPTASRDAKETDALTTAGTGYRLGLAKEHGANSKKLTEEMTKRLSLPTNQANQAYGSATPPGPAAATAPVAPSSTPQIAPSGGAKMKAAGKAGPASAEASGGTGAGPTVLMLRQYAYRHTVADRDLRDTVLWYPAVVVPDGTARVTFDLLSHATTYRVLLYGHSPSGRLGIYQGKIEARK
jgi:hypothetical protein